MLASLVALLALAVCAGAPAGRPRLTLITDSVGGSLGWDGTAARILEQGFDARLELHPCSRLTTPGCLSPPVESTLATIERLRHGIGPNVVIDVGYNDYPTVYAPGIEQVLRALKKDGVVHVFWVTLRAASVQYQESDDAIRGAARRHPELTVVDWNACAAGHPDWFSDDVHLTGAGAQGHARCIRDAVLKVLNAPRPPAIDVELTFPRGVTKGFAAQLRATGGRSPYRFRVAGLPRGVHATRAGRLAGDLPPDGAYRLRVRVTDASGKAAVREVPLRISG